MHVLNLNAIWVLCTEKLDKRSEQRERFFLFSSVIEIFKSNNYGPRPKMLLPLSINCLLFGKWEVREY